MSERELDINAAERTWANDKNMMAQVWQNATNGVPGNQILYFKYKVSDDSYAYELANIADIRKNNVPQEMLSVFDALVVNTMKEAKTLQDVGEILQEKIQDFSSPHNEIDIKTLKNDASELVSTAYLPQEQVIITEAIRQNFTAHYKKYQIEIAQQPNIQQG